MKTSELTGPALEWAVAKCEGWDYDDLRNATAPDRRLHYSTNWAQGGPIIEREGIYIMPGCGTLASITEWDARSDDPEGEPWQTIGPTPLVAAMRCFVASRLGDEVDIPEELT